MELSKKTKHILDFYISYTMKYEEGTDMQYTEDIESAKECALFCVNNTIWVLDSILNNDEVDAEKTEWKRIKEELETL